MMSPYVFCLVFLPLALGYKVHERMTAREVEEIFQTTPDAVPDYEVVQLSMSKFVKRGTRSARALKFKAFGSDLNLWLNPTEGILVGKNTPVFTAKRNNKKKIEFEVYPHAMKNVGKLFENPKYKASVVVNRDSRGRRSINGHIGAENLVVRSLPESILDELMENNSEADSSAYHVVFKRQIKRRNIKQAYNSVSVNETRPRVKRTPNTIPKVVYPEIMVVVDSTLMALNDNNMDKMLAYLAIFWNGVDLLYRGFEDPKFRFNIARIIVAKDQNAVPFISDNMVNPTIFNAYDAIEDSARFWFDLLGKFPENSYDAVVTLTRLDMGDGSTDPDILGIMPKRGGACFVHQRKKYVMKTAIITDNGNFDGVFTAAHEFAHLLGAVHDEWVSCKPKDGYIMSAQSEFTENSHDFSECTVEDIQEWLEDGDGTCLYNVPTTTEPLPRVLPGSFISRDDQCRILKRGKNCFTAAKNQHPCTAIYCANPKNPKSCLESNENAPPDGSFCATGKICLHGKCVRL